VFEESKMNEVVAEIRLLKELQNSTDIGEHISFMPERTATCSIFFNADINAHHHYTEYADN